MKHNKVFYLALPLVLLGCEAIAPGRLVGPATGSAPQPAAITMAGRPLAGGQVPPTTDSTLVAPEAGHAAISRDPAVIENLVPNYGGLVLSIKWPEPPRRKTQAIPSTANSLWIKVYKSGIGKDSGKPAPDGVVIASRVVGREDSDPVPGASPTPGCCTDPNAPKKSTIYLSLPAGTVGVWVGSFAELPGDVKETSTFLSSAQDSVTIQANKLGSPKSLVLGPNPDVAPAITAAPAYVVPGTSFEVKGTNFAPDDLKVSLVASQCCFSPISLGIENASTDSVKVTLPAGAASGKFQVQVETNGFAARSGDVAVLDSMRGIAITVTNTKQYWNGNASVLVAARSSKLTLTSLAGIVCCADEKYELPRSIVTIKSPSGATSSLDASGSFMLEFTGQYEIVAKLGSLSSTQKVGSYLVDFTPQFGTCDGCQGPSYLILQPGDFLTDSGFGFGEPEKLVAWVQNPKFVDSNGDALPNFFLNSDDFSYSSNTTAVLVKNSTRELIPASAGGATITFTYKGSSQSQTKEVTVLGASAVELTGPGSTCPNCNAFFQAKLLFTAPGSNLTKSLGQNSDFAWSLVEGASLASIDAGGTLTSGNVPGTVVIEARLKKNPDFVATRSVTIN